MAKQTRNAPKPEPAFGQGLTRFAARNQKTLFWFSFGLMAVMSLLLFNMRVSEGGDDSTYLCRAMEVVASGRYPDFQGPAYPLFLSLFIFAFGFNLILLKPYYGLFMYFRRFNDSGGRCFYELSLIQKFKH